MHVAAVDHNWLLQFIVLAFAAIGFLYFLWDTASKSFVVDSNSSSNAAEFPPDCRNRDIMAAGVAGAAEVSDSCAVCGFPTKKQCAGCKRVKYCSESCQTSHWKSEHKIRCKDLQSVSKAKHTTSTSGLRQRKSSVRYVGQSSKIIKQSNKILFPYEEFVQIFNWDKPGYAPCGLINCGNSCFANAVLQCLGYTRPLVAYLLEKGHKKECQMGNWCFLCEFQTHVERASQSLTPFSAINILSRLHYIGGSFGYWEQEDAHEFMRYAIGAMQSVCLDEFGGEKVVHPSYQETTLIQHIFGGRLHSQVICSECNNVSDQFENMMDLTVEIHGDAGSLEECLEQFTAKEQLHGDNMYKCDDCNAYVMAWKRLSIQQAPNILTIALKRFKSGRYGKLNKRVTFPETLDLSSYTSNSEDSNDVYRLYAVIVHVDMLNASYFGHYICYVKDFRGNWYRIDDWQVESVDLDEVLSQGAYMLLYRRTCARPSCLLPAEPLKKQENENLKMQVQDTSPMQPTECLSAAGCPDGPVDSGPLISANCSGVDINHDGDLSSTVNAEDTRGDVDMVTCEAASTSFTDKSSVQENDVNENRGKKRDANEGSWSISTEESSGAKNCMFEESTSCTSMPDDDEAKGAAKNLSLESSRPKLRPIFRPGFFEKHPTKVVIKKEDRVSSAGPRERSPQNKRASAILRPVFAPGFLGRHPRKVISRNSVENEEGRQ